MYIYNKKNCMKLKFLFILAGLFSISMSIFAKEPAVSEAKYSAVNETLSTNDFKGIVFDKLTNESLAGAIISSNGKKVYTDLDGNFIIPTNGMEKFSIKVSMISYEDQFIEIDSKRSMKILIKLQQR